MKCMLSRINMVFFLIIMILICGCQQTPERTAVVYGGGLEEKIKGSPAPLSAYDAPESWQETLKMKGGDTTVDIDALISVPDVTAFPVYKVKRTEFGDSQARSLVDYFAKGKDVMKYAQPTKAELENQLIEAKANLAKIKADPSGNDSDIADLEETINFIEAEIPDASESVEPEVIKDWSADKSPAGCFMSENGEYAAISVSPDIFGYSNGYIESESVPAISGQDKIGEIAISKEDAISAAQNMFYELGIDYMAVDNMEKAQRYACLNNTTYTEFSDKPKSKGFLIKFARNIDGIPAIINNGVAFYVMDEFAYKAPLYPEEIQVYVDEAGKAQSFIWFNPLTIEEKLSENVALLPFEEVKQRIRDMLTFINSYKSIPAEVTSINMNMTIVDIKDHPKEAMYVPAWFIYYMETFPDPETGTDVQQESILALNAIDGGRILELPVDISPEIQEQMDKDK